MANEKRKSLSQLIGAFNRAPKDPTAREELRECVGEVPCFIMADGKPDPKESAEAFDFFRATEAAVDGALTFDEMLRQSAPEHEADPVTGRPLFKGKTTDGLKVDWSQVPRDRRLVAAFAADSGQLPIGATSETIAEELREETPRAPWPRLIEAWNKLHASTKPADRARVIEIEARLVFTKEAAPVRAPFVAAPAPVVAASVGDTRDLFDRLTALLPAQFDEVVFRVGCSPSVLRTGAPAERALDLMRWARAQGKIAELELLAGVRKATQRSLDVLVIADPADRAFVEQFKMHLVGMKAESSLDHLPGTVVQAWLDKQIASAKCIALLLTSSLFTQQGEAINRALAAMVTTGTSVVPIRCKPCTISDRLARLGMLPLDEGWVRTPGNDEAWLEAAQTIRRIVGAP